jgi:hypothetical protein
MAWAIEVIDPANVAATIDARRKFAAEKQHVM